jgi:hypothetical protein
VEVNNFDYDWEPRTPEAYRRYVRKQLREYSDDEWHIGSMRELGYVNILPNSIVDDILADEIAFYRAGEPIE